MVALLEDEREREREREGEKKQGIHLPRTCIEKKPRRSRNLPERNHCSQK